MTTDRPVGQLFSHQYLDRSTPLHDRPEFRQRLAMFWMQRPLETRRALCSYLARETGFIDPISYNGLPRVFATLKITQMLDVITLSWRNFAEGSTLRASWLEFVKRVLVEENMGYIVDAECGVHYLVDDEFQHNRAASLRSLGLPRYAAVLAAFNQAYGYLDPDSLDPKSAVRCMFEALEIQAKSMVTTSNLNKYCAQNLLKPLAVAALSNDAATEKVIAATFDAFGIWIDGIHYYRHGQNSTGPVTPPLELAVHILSTGAGYLRLLVDVDQQANSGTG